jgi:hypothetical protein
MKVRQVAPFREPPTITRVLGLGGNRSKIARRSVISAAMRIPHDA